MNNPAQPSLDPVSTMQETFTESQARAQQWVKLFKEALPGPESNIDGAHGEYDQALEVFLDWYMRQQVTIPVLVTYVEDAINTAMARFGNAQYRVDLRPR